jgi:hypothetical protein
MKFSATVQCPLCDWAARHTSDVQSEVVEFLDTLRRRHLAAQHETGDALQPVTLEPIATVAVVNL